MALIDLAFARAAAKRKLKSTGQKSIFEDADEDFEIPAEISAIPDWTPLQKMAAEKEVLGFYLTQSPLDYYADEISKNGEDIEKSKKSEDGTAVRVCGLVSGIRKFSLKNRPGQPSECCSFSVTNSTGEIECVAWPSHFQMAMSTAKADSIVSIKGKLSKRDLKVSIFVNEIRSIS